MDFLPYVMARTGRGMSSLTHHAKPPPLAEDVYIVVRSQSGCTLCLHAAAVASRDALRRPHRLDCESAIHRTVRTHVAPHACPCRVPCAAGVPWSPARLRPSCDHHFVVCDGVCLGRCGGLRSFRNHACCIVSHSCWRSVRDRVSRQNDIWRAFAFQVLFSSRVRV